MLRFPRVVLGYHGCIEPVASDLLNGSRPISDWPPADNKWDWLGKGVYFWEHAPGRARRWAEAAAAREGRAATPGVIGAVIQLGVCFDLTEVAFTTILADAYSKVEEEYAAANQDLPVNKGSDPDLKRRELDCLVLNSLFLRLEDGDAFDTVRGAFEEGDPAFPGSKIRAESHIQIAVRNTANILGVFRPQLP
jgi:hypothetical protein